MLTKKEIKRQIRKYTELRDNSVGKQFSIYNDKVIFREIWLSKGWYKKEREGEK